MAKVFFTHTGYMADTASFRLLGSYISNGLASVGLVKCSDTGQINWGTVDKPSTSTTIAGYEVWRFADSTEQTACPLFLKIFYGTGQTANAFTLNITLCRGTDGAGNVVGEYIDYTAVGNHTTVFTNNYCYISSDSGLSRLAIALFIGGYYTGISGSSIMLYTVDRLRTGDGTPTGDGANFVQSTQNSNLSLNKYGQKVLPPSGAGFPTTPLAKPMCLLPTNLGGSTACPLGGKGTCYSYIFPYRGYAGSPDMNLILYPLASYSVGGGILLTMPMYGQNRQFILLGHNPCPGANSNASEMIGIGVLYE